MYYTRLKVECNKDTTRIARKYGMEFNFDSLANETAKFNSAKHSMFDNKQHYNCFNIRSLASSVTESRYSSSPYGCMCGHMHHAAATDLQKQICIAIYYSYIVTVSGVAT